MSARVHHIRNVTAPKPKRRLRDYWHSYLDTLHLHSILTTLATLIVLSVIATVIVGVVLVAIFIAENIVPITISVVVLAVLVGGALAGGGGGSSDNLPAMRMPAELSDMKLSLDVPMQRIMRAKTTQKTTVYEARPDDWREVTWTHHDIDIIDARKL